MSRSTPEYILAALPTHQTASLPHTRPVRVTDTLSIGGSEVVIAAGPCSIEGFDMLLASARHVKAAGASLLRGGAFKPRTSPYAFQGLGDEGLVIMAEVRDRTGIPIVTEVLDTRQVDRVAQNCRRHAGRRSQHAELRIARGIGALRQTGPPQTRCISPRCGITARRRTHHGEWQ